MIKKLSILLILLVSTALCGSTEPQNDLISVEIEPTEFHSPSTTYKVIEKLGEGAFGKVYSVENGDGVKYALKVVKNHDWATGGFLSLLMDAKREFTRGQSLDHPHIIRSYEYFTLADDAGNKTCHVVLELVEGDVIYRLKRGDLSKEEAVGAAIDLLEALRYALREGLVHLDLHAGNVMLSEGHQVKVIDLASFYTYDEIAGFVKKEIQNQAAEGKASVEKEPQHYAKAMKKAPIQADGDKDFDEKRVLRLQKFFMLHPDVHQKVVEEVKQSMESDYSKQMRSTAKPRYAQPSTSKQLSSINSHYFETIAVMCNEIIGKSDISRHDKFDLRVDILKSAWNCIEDVEEGQKILLEEYFLELDQILRSHRLLYL